jgi:hypothetical protein
MMDVMTRCPLQVPNVHNMGPKCDWASSISFEKNMNQAKGKQREKIRSSTAYNKDP